MFPHHHPSNFPVRTGWQTAVEHGATLRWALQAADMTADEAVADSDVAFLVLHSLWLATEIPVSAIDGLLAAGWSLTEMTHLMGKKGYEDLIDGGFPNTVRRLSALHQIAPGIGGPDGALLWHALTAVLSAGPAGLTDLQALRWLQTFASSDRKFWVPRVVLAVSSADNNAEVLREWVSAAGPDGWLWAAAGYSRRMTRVLRGLPVGHPDRPGPDQLAVMAALRGT